MKCAVVGLGEVGARYAAALAEAGHDVVGADPADTPTPEGVVRVGSVAEAVDGAEVVLVMTSASVAPLVAEEALPVLAEGVCYADFTSSAPSQMRRLSELVGGTGAAFADVAILGPVPWHGAATPLMVSGPGGAVVADLLRPLGAPIDLLDEAAGAAMAHKLLRSVFMKGLASLIGEAVAVGRAAGYEEWIRGQVAAALAGDGQAVIDRLLTGTQTHALRRMHEVDDAAGYLEELGVEPTMTRATVDSHRAVLARQAAPESERQSA
jgi:3-hydroxyisobutyrate dehydrogenase-like beta-hydroxyacid dehydrogenase